MEVDVAGKKITLVHTEDGAELTNVHFLIQGNQMKGKVQATRWFEAGPVESTYMVKGNDHVLNIVFNNKEVMKSKMNIKNNMLKAKTNFDFVEEYRGTMYID